MLLLFYNSSDLKIYILTRYTYIAYWNNSKNSCTQWNEFKWILILKILISQFLNIISGSYMKTILAFENKIVSNKLGPSITRVTY